MFLASGTALLAITYILVRQATNNTVPNGKPTTTQVFVSGKGIASVGFGAKQQMLGNGPVLAPLPDKEAQKKLQQLIVFARHQRDNELNQLLMQSGIALGIMAIVSIWLGWLVAGRALGPLRTITAAARDISASNLHRRLALEGPDDELRELGDTFDGLLERLESSFAAQRQFVANASHELRTPLTLERALLEVALSDPDASVESLRVACEQALEAGKKQEELIEALLILSRSQRGLDRRTPVNLAAVSRDTIDSFEPNGVHIDTSLRQANANGDPHLIERLVANLVGNAIAYNVDRGWVDVTTASRDGRAILRVRNSGPVVAPGDVDRLLEPFQRREGARIGNGDGLGLGLSIVQAIARAHAAEFVVNAPAVGGLDLEVAFPAA
ncbi:MAG TPA: ATP-binding protein [Gaiellaceae bacterium]|nr:ATP-binding protein [Gaiellaceae bacterium]